MTAVLEMLYRVRLGEITKLGPRPPRWQVLRRHHWDKKRRAIGERYYLAARALYIEQGTLSPGIEAAMRDLCRTTKKRKN